jgi:rod shape-determining protein MreD
MTASPFRLYVVLIVAFILHESFGDNLTIFGARPNLCLATMYSAALLTNSTQAALMGFVTGMLEGAYGAGALGTFITSRTLTGWMAGCLENFVFRDSPVVACLVAFGGTLLAYILAYMFNPQGSFHLVATVAGAAYTGVLAIPVFIGLRRFAGTKQSD